MYKSTNVDELHSWVRNSLQVAGVPVAAIVYCPHAEDEACGCRKPMTGMADEVQRQLKRPIDYSNSWTIGDKISDLGFGEAAGTKTVLLESRYWNLDRLTISPTFVATSLLHASSLIVGNDSSCRIRSDE